MASRLTMFQAAQGEASAHAAMAAATKFTAVLTRATDLVSNHHNQVLDTSAQNNSGTSLS